MFNTKRLALRATYSLLVPGLGFEPRLPGPKPGVLPLDDPGSMNLTIRLYQQLDIVLYIIHKKQIFV